MTKTATHTWDVAEHLENEDDMAAYLEAAFEEGDPSLIAAALGDIARARGMSQIAREAGLGRESLYKALSGDGNPELGTILKVVSSFMRRSPPQRESSKPRLGHWRKNKKANFECLN